MKQIICPSVLIFLLFQLYCIVHIWPVQACEAVLAVPSFDINGIDLTRPESLSLDTLFLVAAYYAQCQDTQQQAFWSEKLVEHLSAHGTLENFNKVADWCIGAADSANGYISELSRKGAAYLALQIYHALCQLGTIQDSLEIFRKQGMLAQVAGLEDGIPPEYLDTNTGFLTPAYLFCLDQDSKELAILKKMSELFFNTASRARPGSSILIA